eukprot:scaffold7841_cov484-Prasinococcus_capsulatus_cf.AAC.2
MARARARVCVRVEWQWRGRSRWAVPLAAPQRTRFRKRWSPRLACRARLSVGRASHHGPDGDGRAERVCPRGLSRLLLCGRAGQPRVQHIDGIPALRQGLQDDLRPGSAGPLEGLVPFRRGAPPGSAPSPAPHALSAR